MPLVTQGLPKTGAHRAQIAQFSEYPRPTGISVVGAQIGRICARTSPSAAN